jgi:hypothetical protein
MKPALFCIICVKYQGKKLHCSVLEKTNVSKRTNSCIEIKQVKQIVQNLPLPDLYTNVTNNFGVYIHKCQRNMVVILILV